MCIKAIAVLTVHCIYLAITRLEIREKENHFEYLETLANHSSIMKDLGQSAHGSRKLKALAFCRMRRLTKHQQKLCSKFPLQVLAAFRGFHQAVKECQHQFRNQRWNCSSIAKMKTNGQPLFTSIMRRGTVCGYFQHNMYKKLFNCVKPYSN